MDVKSPHGGEFPVALGQSFAQESLFRAGFFAFPLGEGVAVGDG